MFVISTAIRARSHVLHTDDENDSTKFEPNLEHLWKLESIGINPNDSKEKDDIAMEMFKSTVTKEDNLSQLAMKKRRLIKIALSTRKTKAFW